jgi:hypothetical protein
VGGKGRPTRKADNLTANCESLDVSQPYGPPQPVTGKALALAEKTNYTLNDFSGMRRRVV